MTRKQNHTVHFTAFTFEVYECLKLPFLWTSTCITIFYEDTDLHYTAQLSVQPSGGLQENLKKVD